MPLIISADPEGEGLVVYNPDAGAKVGRWCRAPLVPDRCDHCFDPETLAHYPATGFREEEGGRRYGTCPRCQSSPASKEATR